MPYPFYYLGDQWIPRLPDIPISPFFNLRWAEGKREARDSGIYYYSPVTREWGVYKRDIPSRFQCYPFIVTGVKVLDYTFPLTPPLGYRPIHYYENYRDDDVICWKRWGGSREWVTIHQALYLTPMSERVPEYRLRRDYILRRIMPEEECDLRRHSTVSTSTSSVTYD